MIRKLTENDRTKVLEYLYTESDFNIFPIGDIESFGFNEPFQTVYGEFDNHDNYLSILLFYRENVIYYTHLDTLNKDYLAILENHQYNFLSGKEELMNLLHKSHKTFKKQPMYFCSINQIKQTLSVDKDVKKLSTEEDFGALYDLLIDIKEFSVAKQDKESFISNKQKSLQMSQTVGIFKDNILVATAATTAETTKSAMVVGVATNQSYRNKGYASSCVMYLANHFIKEQGKSLSLFYDNPKAGSIYHKIGFEDIGKWTMLKRKW